MVFANESAIGETIAERAVLLGAAGAIKKSANSKQ